MPGVRRTVGRTGCGVAGPRPAGGIILAAYPCPRRGQTGGSRGVLGGQVPKNLNDFAYRAGFKSPLWRCAVSIACVRRPSRSRTLAGISVRASALTCGSRCCRPRSVSLWAGVARSVPHSAVKRSAHTTWKSAVSAPPPPAGRGQSRPPNPLALGAPESQRLSVFCP
jgi:hypothetical protein